MDLTVHGEQIAHLRNWFQAVSYNQVRNGAYSYAVIISFIYLFLLIPATQLHL